MRFVLLASLLVLALPAWADCGRAKTVFQCETSKGKRVEVCDAGRSISYSFGRPGNKEAAFAVPRHQATTYQWSGVGSSKPYYVRLDTGARVYTVFHIGRLPGDKTPVDVGVEVEVVDTSSKVIYCDPARPWKHAMKGIDLKPLR